MLVKFLVTLIMVAGLLCTVSIKMPGTLLILLSTVIYGIFTDFSTFSTPLIVVLISISVTAELGGRMLRIYLTKDYSVSREFSVNSSISHIGGVVATNALFGPLWGLIIWELLAGKTLLPRGNTMVKVLTRLAGVALIRIVCGIVMIILVHVYIFI